MPASAPAWPEPAGGDFDDFCRRVHPRLVGSMTLYCGDPFAAEDFAQEALARA